MPQAPTFTIFIPAYNRAHTIRRALDSILRQSLDDYEILVIDDGSTDGTREAVERWKQDNRTELRYVYQPNGGKHVAHNHAVSLANGELLMVLDSDDTLLPDCLQEIYQAWSSIPADRKMSFAGVEGLCITSDSRLHGTAYPEDVFDTDYLEATGRYGVRGEKRSALRVDVLRQFPYPVFAGQYHMRPSFIWKRIAHHYKLRCINRPLHSVDFAPDGLTAQASKRRLRNVQGLFAYWRDDVLHHQQYLNRKRRRKHYAEYVRYGLHSGHSLLRQWREAPDRGLWLGALPRALPNYLADRLKKRRYGLT